MTMSNASPVESSKKQIRKRRAKKSGPAPPKRARSAYMLFAMEARKELSAKNPKATFGELGKLAAEKWKTLSEKEKQPYVDRSEKEKVNADVAMAEFKQKQAESALVLNQNDADSVRAALNQASEAVRSALEPLSK